MPKYFKQNNERIKDIASEEWIEAIHKCRSAVKNRIKGRTKYGAHSELTLGGKAEEVYTGKAIDLLLEGRWEFKKEFSLTDQLIRIVGSLISTNVEKQDNIRDKPLELSYIGENSNIVDEFYNEELQFEELEVEEKKKLEKQFSIIENFAKTDSEYFEFFECVCEQLRPYEIAELMGKDVKSIYRLTETFKKKARKEIKKNKNGKA